MTACSLRGLHRFEAGEEGGGPGEGGVEGEGGLPGGKGEGGGGEEFLGELVPDVAGGGVLLGAREGGREGGIRG